MNPENSLGPMDTGSIPPDMSGEISNLPIKSDYSVDEAERRLEATRVTAAEKEKVRQSERDDQELAFIDGENKLTEGNNFDLLKQELEGIRELINKYNHFNEELKDDSSNEVYVDDYEARIKSAFGNFTIGGIVVDVTKMSQEISVKEIFNDVVLRINEFIEMYTFPSGEREYLKTI